MPTSTFRQRMLQHVNTELVAAQDKENAANATAARHLNHNTYAAVCEASVLAAYWRGYATALRNISSTFFKGKLQ